jgi:hypothetical membrane protein
MIKIFILTLLITTSVHADWFYDTVEAIDDAGIASPIPRLTEDVISICQWTE